jgi:hypothetical protein
VIRRGAAVLLAGLLVLPACSGGSSNNSPKDSKPGSVSAQAELTYGRAPVAGGGITYQPDVVLVGGGADMVRSVSGDSMTWTIDAKAPHIDELEPGKVMFLTGRGVGRVLQLERNDDVVVVTLGPVDLTDVIYDGDINVSQPIDVGAMTLQTYPDIPGPVEESSGDLSPAAESTGSVKQAMWTDGQRVDATLASVASSEKKPLPPATIGESVKISLGDYTAQLAHTQQGDTSELSLKMAYKRGGLVVGFDVGAKFVAPTVTANLSFSSGTLTKNELRVDGLKEVSVGLDSGTKTGLHGNVKARMEVPAELNFPIPTGTPVPVMGSVRFKFIFTTAFSARNATLAAQGKLEVDGPIGFSGKEVLVPQVKEAKSPLDNMSGVSVGVNGVVLAVQFKVVIGIGVPAAFAGPFGAFTVSYGMTNGSSIGITHCLQTTIDVIIAGGVGYTLTREVGELINGLASKLPWKVKADSELLSVSKSVIHEVEYEPKLAVCKID